MFSFLIGRPDTPSMSAASQSMRETKSYLLNSTDPTEIYLQSSLSKVQETASLWKKAEGNSTNSFTRKFSGMKQSALWESVLLWLTGQSDNSKVHESSELNLRNDFMAVRDFGGLFAEVLKVVLERDLVKV
jgi:hypothetical protein